MKEGFINGARAIVANDQAAIIAQPREGAFYLPATPVTAERAAILRARLAAIPAMWGNQFHASRRQPCTQRIAVIAAIPNDALGFLARPAPSPTASHTDGGERFFRKPRFVRGRRVKLLSQRNTLAVDHHHPLRALAPLGFSDFRAPFFAGAKLPSRNDSLQSSCSRSFNSAKKARQMASQILCSSQSRSRRQQVLGEGNSSGKSCHERHCAKSRGC